MLFAVLAGFGRAENQYTNPATISRTTPIPKTRGRQSDAGGGRNSLRSSGTVSSCGSERVSSIQPGVVTSSCGGRCENRTVAAGPMTGGKSFAFGGEFSITGGFGLGSGG